MRWRATGDHPRPGACLRLNPLASATAPTPRYKIVVNHDGVYRVTYADLQAAGLDVSTLDPRNLQTDQSRVGCGHDGCG